MAEIIRLFFEIESLLRVVFYVVGILFVIQALRQCAHRSEIGLQAGSWSKPITTFMIGLLFVVLPTTIGFLSKTLFDQPPSYNPSSIFEYDFTILAPVNSGYSREIIELVIRFIQLIGLIAVLRGLLLFNQISTQGSRVVGPGFTFLFAGVLAISFPEFWGLIVNLMQTVNGLGT